MKKCFFSNNTITKLGIFFVFIFIFIVFGNLGDKMDTAPFGDAIDHTMYISLIIESKKFPTTYLPVDNWDFSLIGYPPGLWCLGVFTSLFSFNSPMISVTFLATLSSALIPLLIWSAIFIRTKSISISLIALFFSLIIPNWAINAPLDGHDLVLGNLVNGSYPNQLGSMELIGLSAFLIQSNENGKITLNENEKLQRVKKGDLVYNLFSYVGIFLIGVSTIITHYLFTIFVGIIAGIKSFSFLLEKLLKRIKNGNIKQKNFYTNVIYVLMVGMSAVIVLTIILGITPLLAKRFVFPTTELIAPNFFIENPFGVLMLVSIIVFVIRQVVSKEKILHFDLFYLISLFVIFTIFFFPITQQYFLTFAYRSVIPVAGIAIMQLSCDFSLIVSKIREKRIGYFKKNYSEKTKLSLIIILISLNVVNTSVYPQLAVIWTVGYGTSDYEAMVWINQNVDKNALILNEPTFIGYFLPGFKYRNVVFVRVLSMAHASDMSYYPERASHAMEIFSDPTNYTNVQNIMNAYQIEYLYLTDLNQFFDYASFTYNQKPYSVTNQTTIFSANPYLELVWNQGNSAVFKLK